MARDPAQHARSTSSTALISLSSNTVRLTVLCLFMIRQASLSKRSQRSQLASGSGAATIVGSSSQAEPRVSIPMFTASASSTASKRRLRLRGTTAEVKVQPTNGSGAVALTRQRQQQQNGKVTTPSAAPAAAATGLSSPPGHSAVSRPRTVSKSGGTASGVKNNKQLSNKGSPLRARHDSVLVADSAEDDDGLFDGKGDVVPDNAFEQGGYWPAKRIVRPARHSRPRIHCH